MKKLLLVLLPILCSPIHTYTQDTESQYIEWFGEDTVANSLVWMGMDHLMNIEREKAYTFFEAAIAQDPSLFAPHTQLALMSSGDKREDYKAKAKKLVYGKNEVSQLFVSLLDIERGPGAGEKWRATWKKMYSLAFDGRFVHFRYAQSLQDSDARMAELEKLAAKNEADGINNGHIHNLLGYGHYANGNKEKAKMHFDKYLELRPKGYNAYDSMAEYYVNEGDLEKSLKYYKKAREHFPGSTSARDRIEELETRIANADKGNLFLVHSEYVYPEHVSDYMQWGKEYKEVAARTNFKDFYVSRGDGAFYYITNVGKELSDVDAYEDTWDEWNEANPEVGEMYEKYKHTVKKTKRLLWRHMPAHSYSPDEPGESPNTYSRVYFAYIKYGQEETAMNLLKEFKSQWESSGVTEGFQVYRNVFGEEGTCLAIVSSFESPKEWLADQEDVKEKVEAETLGELMSKWNKIVRKGDSTERYPLPDLSHSNPNE